MIIDKNCFQDCLKAIGPSSEDLREGDEKVVRCVLTIGKRVSSMLYANFNFSCEGKHQPYLLYFFFAPLQSLYCEEQANGPIGNLRRWNLLILEVLRVCQVHLRYYFCLHDNNIHSYQLIMVPVSYMMSSRSSFCK